jgi:hypothetical protein
VELGFLAIASVVAFFIPISGQIPLTQSADGLAGAGQDAVGTVTDAGQNLADTAGAAGDAATGTLGAVTDAVDPPAGR